MRRKYLIKKEIILEIDPVIKNSSGVIFFGVIYFLHEQKIFIRNNFSNGFRTRRGNLYQQNKVFR